jgi:hypothetical protein
LNRASPPLVIAGVCLTIAIIGGIFWADLRWADLESGGRDFAVYWASARTLLEYNASPYGDLAAEQSEKAAGVTVDDPGLAGYRLDLPLYTEMIAFPFAVITRFEVARAAWTLLLEAGLVGTSLLCLRLLGRPPRYSFYLLPLFAVLWVQAVWPLSEGNAIILAALFIVAGLEALHRESDEAAGVLLALATFKFLTLGVLLLFLLVWAIDRRRWRLIFAYIMALAVLIVLSYFFFPAWFIPYLRAFLINVRGPELVSMVRLIGGTFPATSVRFSHIVSGLIALVLLWEWWLARGRDFRHMLWTASLSLTLTPLLGFPTSPENYAALILPVGLVVLLCGERWGRVGLWIVLGFLLSLFLLLWAIYATANNPALALFFPAPVILAFALYWVRWWAIQPPRTWVQTLRETA